MKTQVLDYDERLARQVLDDEGDSTSAAVTLFERHDPESLTGAAQLVRIHGGELSPEAFDRVVHAYDTYRHIRDMPCD